MLPVWFTDTVTPDLDRALGYTLLWGLEGVVLRAVGKRGDRVPHVNEAKVKRRIAEHEVPVVAIDPGLFESPAEARGAWMNDLAMLSEVAAFCGRIGCRSVLVGALPGDDALASEALRKAGAAAERHGLVLAVRNEIGGRATGRSLARLLGAVGHAHVRAAWSPADALEAGESASEGLTALAADLAFVSVRDGVAASSGWEPRGLGDGEIGWADLLSGLHEAGYAGPLGLDLRDLAMAREGLAEATSLIQMIRRAQRS